MAFIFLIITFALLKSCWAACMECYQCSSEVGVDSTPYCVDGYWQTLTDKKKEELVVGCPPRISGYCIKKEATYRGRTKTQRACVGNKDSRGQLLASGCLSYKDNGTDVNICLCQKPKCNFGEKIAVQFCLLLIFCVNIILMMFPEKCDQILLKN